MTEDGAVIGVSTNSVTQVVDEGTNVEADYYAINSSELIRFLDKNRIGYMMKDEMGGNKNLTLILIIAGAAAAAIVIILIIVLATGSKKKKAANAPAPAPAPAPAQAAPVFRKSERSLADVVILDAGFGAGLTFDHELIGNYKRPFILAGGLNLNNISTVIAELRPYGVDVSSGVETENVKDPEKIMEFVRLARGVFV